MDRDVESFVRVPKAVTNTHFRLSGKEEIAVSDPTNSVVGHHFSNQFETDADLDKIKTPVITHDPAETARRLEAAHELFDGTLDVFEDGVEPSVSVWDPIRCLMNVESALYALADRPEYMAELVRRLVAGHLSALDQLEEQGLLSHRHALIHCTGAHTDDLPAPGFDPARPRTRDIWMFGLAQVRKIPNVRKISMSPWVDEALGAAEIKGNYVYSRKPNPAMLAWSEFNEKAVREHLRATVDVCAEAGCPLELILKDISTVKYEPKRLWRWAEIAMETVGA